MLNNCRTSAEPLRNPCGILERLKNPCGTLAKPLRNSCRTLAKPLRFLCRTECLWNPCGTTAELLRITGGSYSCGNFAETLWCALAVRLRNPCNTLAEPPLWNQCGTLAEPLQNPCGLVKPLRNPCGTFAESLQNPCGPVNVEPLRYPCGTLAEHLRNTCGTFADTLIILSAIINASTVDEAIIHCDCNTDSPSQEITLL